MERAITHELRGAVAIVRFAAPPSGQITIRAARELLDTMGSLLADAHVRAIILTGGQPGIFIRHASIADIARGSLALAEGRASLDDYAEGAFIRLGALLDNADKPVIAAIDGLCMGGGYEIALSCVLRIAGTERTLIGLPEIRLDICPGSGGIPRLARLIGPHRARRLALLGTLHDGAAALAEGLVDEVAADPLKRAMDLAEALSVRHPAAVAAILRSATSGVTPADTARIFGQVVAEPKVLERLDRHLASGVPLEDLT